jgi:hypothetical protein
VPGAQLEDFGSGLTPVTQGWFVVNVRDAEWWFSERRGARCAFESEYGDPPVEFAQFGINVTVLCATFERGARLVDFDVRASGEILVTPSFRKRGCWELSPEAQWIRLTRPSDADLGHAAIEAAARSTA